MAQSNCFTRRNPPEMNIEGISRSQPLRAALVALLALLLASFATNVYAQSEAQAAASAETASENSTFDETARALEAEQAEPALTAEAVQTEGNHLWTLLAAVLVFWMQAGFSLVEAGFTRAKNAANIMMKNAADMCFGVLAFWLVGFGLMFGAAGSYGLFGTSEFLLSGLGADGSIDQDLLVFWLFQSVFCATAATIVSGAMAGRTNFPAYLIFSVAISAFIYPVYGKWAWGSLREGGDGWLNAFTIGGAGFIDYAGSTVVHSVGGWCALAGAICVGPRIGKYAKDGKPRLIPGHNLVYGMIGTFILWMGWFGFNAGSTTAIGGSEFAAIAVTTMLAACAGGAVGMVASRSLFGKWDLAITCNGILGGLVGITAPCYNVSPLSAIIIGAVAGAIIPFSIKFFDSIKVDDPVGAISVHLVCGIWGTLAAGIFAQESYGGVSGLIEGNFNQVLVQLVGIGAAGLWTFPTALIVFKGVDALVGLRVSPEIEEAGLDVEEHGIGAYPSSMIFDSASTPRTAT